MPSRSHPTIHPYGVYETTGAPLLIAIQNEREFQKLCSVVLLDPSLPDDPRFATNVARVEHEEEFDEVMNAVFGATQPNPALPCARAHLILSRSVTLRRDTCAHSLQERCVLLTPGDHCAVLVSRSAMPE